MVGIFFKGLVMATIEVKSENEFLVRLMPDEVERFKRYAKNTELTYVNLIMNIIQWGLRFIRNMEFI